MPTLVRSDADHPIQAFPLREGFIHLIAADNPVTDVSLVKCVVDGDITLTFRNGGIKSLNLIEGEIYSLHNVKSVAIGVGAFHFG